MADSISIAKAPDIEFTRAEIRQKIGVIVGRRQRGRSQLNIGTLNSAYAYLTGEFYAQPRVIGTELSPGIDRIRWAVVIQASNLGYDFSSYIPTPEDVEDGEEEPSRPLRRKELETLALCLKESEDQRRWTNG